jgi:ATP-dependent exoDNAse (exonuclease V) beta subunit
MRELGVKNLTDAPLSADNAVKIMTVHKSKGLEFAAVALPRLGRSAFQHSDKLLFGKDLGIALDCTRDREELKPSFFVAANNLSRKMDEEEKKRLLYVALTRSRDYLGIFITPRCKSGTNFGSWLIQALDLPLPEGEIVEETVRRGDGEECCSWVIRQDLPAKHAEGVFQAATDASLSLDADEPFSLDITARYAQSEGALASQTQDPSAQHTQDPSAPHTQDPSAPHTQEPSAPHTQDPPTPHKQDPSAPYIQEPSAPHIQDLSAPHTQDPSAPYKLDPSAPHTQDPSAPHTQDPSAPYKLDPSAPHTQDPSAPHTQDPYATHTQDRSAPHTQNPSAPRTQDPSAPYTQAPSAPHKIEKTNFTLLSDKQNLTPTYPPVPWQALLRACPVESDGTVHATIAGNYFHLLMSSLGPDLQLPSEENRRALLLSHEVDVHDKRQQERLLQESETLLITFKNSSLFQLMKSARRRIEESAYIIFDPDSGDNAELRPDLIIEDKDQNWHIIDYKTDHLEAKQVSRQVAAHRAQLLRYVTDIETLLGVRAKAWIYFAQLGRLEPVDINQPAQLSLF